MTLEQLMGEPAEPVAVEAEAEPAQVPSAAAEESEASDVEPVAAVANKKKLTNADGSKPTTRKVSLAARCDEQVANMLKNHAAVEHAVHPLNQKDYDVGSPLLHPAWPVGIDRTTFQKFSSNVVTKTEWTALASNYDHKDKLDFKTKYWIPWTPKAVLDKIPKVRAAYGKHFTQVLHAEAGTGSAAELKKISEDVVTSLAQLATGEKTFDAWQLAYGDRVTKAKGVEVGGKRKAPPAAPQASTPSALSQPGGQRATSVTAPASGRGDTGMLPLLQPSSRSAGCLLPARCGL